MASLPSWLDYDEINVPDEDNPDAMAVPLVRCLLGCGWTYDACWSDLGDDQYGLDWPALHPQHPARRTP